MKVKRLYFYLDLDEKVYKDLSILAIKKGLSKRQLIKLALDKLLKFYYKEGVR